MWSSSNILVTASDFVYLVDFGIARCRSSAACTIADDQGNVLDTKTGEAAFASVSCAVYP